MKNDMDKGNSREMVGKCMVGMFVRLLDLDVGA